MSQPQTTAKPDSVSPAIDAEADRIINDPLLTRAEVQKWSGLKRTALYDLMKANKFPRPLKVTSRITLWPLSELVAWRQSLSTGAQTSAQ